MKFDFAILKIEFFTGANVEAHLVGFEPLMLQFDFMPSWRDVYLKGGFGVVNRSAIKEELCAFRRCCDLEFSRCILALVPDEEPSNKGCEQEERQDDRDARVELRLCWGFFIARWQRCFILCDKLIDNRLFALFVEVALALR